MLGTGSWPQSTELERAVCASSQMLEEWCWQPSTRHPGWALDKSCSSPPLILITILEELPHLQLRKLRCWEANQFFPSPKQISSWAKQFQFMLGPFAHHTALPRGERSVLLYNNAPAEKVRGKVRQVTEGEGFHEALSTPSPSGTNRCLPGVPALSQACRRASTETGLNKGCQAPALPL